MTERKFTEPTEFPAEYVDGNGNKAVILGRGPDEKFPFIGYDANGYAATWTELGKYHHGGQSKGDLHDDMCSLNDKTMSDDLMKRLDSLHKQATVERSHFYVGSCVKDAMHRIEELEAEKYHDAWLEVEIAELEAKLAKAVKALGRIGSGEFSGQVLTSMPPQDAAAFFARSALATLSSTMKGQDDD